MSSFAQEHLLGRPDRVRMVFEWAGTALGRRSGEEWRVTCPFHPDEHPSLDINLEKAAFLCRACGAGGDAVDFYAQRLGFSVADAIVDLKRHFGLNGNGQPERQSAPRRAVRKTTYEIKDPGRTVIALHYRTDFDDGDKAFGWGLPSGLSGLGGLPVADLPLYGSEHVASWHPDEPVIVTEGEKAADALTARGYRALGTVTGAKGTPAASVLEVLRGHGAVTWPDNDEPGREHMRRVAQRLAGIAKSVRVMEWGERPKDDAADFWARGGTKGQLDRMLGEAASVAPARAAEFPDSEDKAASPNDVPRGWRTPAEVLEAIPQPKFRFRTGIPSLDLAGRGGLPTGIVVVLAGWPDAGKTGLGTQIVIEIAIHYDVVAVLFTPDGGQEATAIRIGGLLGLDQDKLEARDPEEKEALASELRDRRIFIIDDSLDGMVFERIVADAERYRPDLPHVYLLDSAQECLANEKADELDERHRVIALMRAVYRTVEANPVPSLAIVTSQVSGQAFAPSRKADRMQPMGAPAESKKISFLSHLIVSLEGDPGREPDFGRAAVVKSKLRGPKPCFGLRVDTSTSRLSEIDAIAVEQERTERRERERTEETAKLGEQIASLLAKHGRLNVTAIQERTQVKKARILEALNGLEAQSRAAWAEGPHGAHIWNLTDLERKSRGVA